MSHWGMPAIQTTIDTSILALSQLRCNLTAAGWQNTASRCACVTLGLILLLELICLELSWVSLPITASLTCQHLSINLVKTMTAASPQRKYVTSAPSRVLPDK